MNPPDPSKAHWALDRLTRVCWDWYGDAEKYDADDNGSYSGSAYVYYGSASGILSSSEEKLKASDGAADDAFGLPAELCLVVRPDQHVAARCPIVDAGDAIVRLLPTATTESS